MKVLMQEIVEAFRAAPPIMGALLLAAGCAGSWNIEDLGLSFEELCWVFTGAGLAFLVTLEVALRNL